jgi:hypothetical protein
MKKIQRHEYWSVIQPPRVGPTTGASRAARAKSHRHTFPLAREDVEQHALAARLKAAAR